MFAVHNKQPMEFLDSSAPLYGRARRWWGSILKNEPTDNSANVMLPQDVIGLLK